MSYAEYPAVYEQKRYFVQGARREADLFEIAALFVTAIVFVSAIVS